MAAKELLHCHTAPQYEKVVHLLLSSVHGTDAVDAESSDVGGCLTSFAALQTSAIGSPSNVDNLTDDGAAGSFGSLDPVHIGVRVLAYRLEQVVPPPTLASFALATM